MSLDMDREFEIAALAAASERRNSPARLVILAVALLVIGVSFAGFGRARASAAADSVARAQADARRVETLAQTIARLEAATAEDWATQYEPYALIRSELSNLARIAGLEREPNWSDPRDEALQDSPLTRRMIHASLSGVELGAFLTWITSAQEAIDGLEIVSLDLTPMDVGWNVQCRFGRWEKRQ